MTQSHASRRFGPAILVAVAALVPVLGGLFGMTVTTLSAGPPTPSDYVSWVHHGALGR